MAPITTYMPVEDGSGRTIARIVYDDATVVTTILPVAKRGLMPGATKGKHRKRSPGVDTGSLGRSAQ